MNRNQPRHSKPRGWKLGLAEGVISACLALTIFVAAPACPHDAIQRQGCTEHKLSHDLPPSDERGTVGINVKRASRESASR